MFNTAIWSTLTKDTYGYETFKFVDNGLKLHYSKVKNKIGDYIISPSFGDFVRISSDNFTSLDNFGESEKFMPIKLKIWSDTAPETNFFDVREAGFIHEIDFNSKEHWLSDKISYNFRRYLKSSLKTRISNTKEDIRDFFLMHTKLRFFKFKEIPQPWSFFEKIYENYFKSNKGYVISCYDPDENLIAGILFIIHKSTCYYKFNASYPEGLKYQPNNILIGNLIDFCSEKGIKKLNLGFTGSSKQYSGLRKFKLKAGASEHKRYILENKASLGLDRSLIKKINSKIKILTDKEFNQETVNEYSNKYYKYFI